MPTLPAVDLVVATIGRTAELSRLLRSLDQQTFRDFRVVVVDQNGDDRLDPVLARYEQTLAILRLSSTPGLSRARNVALRHVSGDVVAFPDDDCWYPPDLLERVSALLAAHPEWDGLSVRSVDGTGRPSNMRWDPVAGSIDRFNIWRRAISYSFFLRRRVVDSVGGFAEDLGVGAESRWRSGEETDYLLRAIGGRFALHYDPGLSVHHESPRPTFGRNAVRQGYESGLGNGRVLARHGFPWWFVLYRVGQLAAAASIFLVSARPAKAQFYFAMAVGRMRGWLGGDKA